MNIAVPIWLPEHILSHDPSCKDISQSSHSCSECEDWMNQFIEGDSPILTNDCDGSLYDFKSMCGLWATVDQFKGMCAANEDYPDWMIKYSLGFASQILYALSGRQFFFKCGTDVSEQVYARSYIGYILAADGASGAYVPAESDDFSVSVSEGESVTVVQNRDFGTASAG